MYNAISNDFKILADENRLKVIDMISCRKINGKELLNFLEISQPTLSHHIKVLEENKYIIKEKIGNEIFYSLNREKFCKITMDLNSLYHIKEDCLCFQKDITDDID